MRSTFTNLPSRSISALCALLFLTACQPVDEAPGTWLRGEESSEIVSDWEFTDAFEEIFIQTQPWHLVAHSTTIWCVHFDGKLYIGSYGDDAKAWETHVLGNDNATLLIDGKLYDVVVSELTDSLLSRKIRAAYDSKYDMAAVFGEVVPDWHSYAVTQTR